ncbi:hypothetical protein C0J52_09784 [Blattella germanica]|nr:hypothetical protein C0J52_09784 [Blattella germanica]
MNENCKSVMLLSLLVTLLRVMTQKQTYNKEHWPSHHIAKHLITLKRCSQMAVCTQNPYAGCLGRLDLHLKAHHVGAWVFKG